MKKKTTIITLAFAAILGTAFKPVEKKGEDYKVSAETSNIEWIGKKVTGEHKGGIKISNGELNITNGAITGGNFVIDMNSITCSDLQGEWSDKLIGHLKSEDFFSVQKHTNSTFKITKVTPIKTAKNEGEANNTITGNLTIKGNTQEISFPAYVLVKNDGIVAIGEASVDRTKFDIKYGSANFFEGLGDKAISNDFIIKFTLAAKKS